MPSSASIVDCFDDTLADATSHCSHSSLRSVSISLCMYSVCLQLPIVWQEIKEEAEKRRRSDEGAGSLTLSVAAPYVTRVAAELMYDYKDRYKLCCIGYAYC